MAALSDIVTVTISTTSAAVKQPGFGVACILDYNTRFAERIRFYNDLDAMITDGFTVNDAAYKAASAVLAQNPQVTKVAIGRRALNPTLKVDITPTAQNLKAYKVRVVSVTGVVATATYTSDSTATVAEITAGLKVAIDALALSGITTTDNTTYLSITATVATNWFAVEVLDLSVMSSKQTHADPGIATDAAAVNLENSAFYGVTATTASAAEVSALAAWVESNKKLSLRMTQDCEIIAVTTGDIATTLKNANYFRTGLIFHPAGDAFADCAWFGATFPLDPGSLTFKFKQLAGVPGVPLTATQLANLRGKNCNAFTDYGGINITVDGKLASGEWIDIIRDRDWFESRLQTRIANVMIGSAKIPFTDGGIAQIEAEVRGQLREGIDSGYLTNDPAPLVVVPKASAVSSGDKTLRQLTGISFTAKVAGAIHAVTIKGTITV